MKNKSLIYKIVNKAMGYIYELKDSWKYDRALSRCYKNANRTIKEAQQLAISKGYVYYVLPDKNGQFFCFNGKERDAMRKLKIIPNYIDGMYCIKNAIFIARPTRNNVKREFKPTRIWLLGK